MKLTLELDDRDISILRDQLRVRHEDIDKFHSGEYGDSWDVRYAVRIMKARQALKMEGDVFLSKDSKD